MDLLLYNIDDIDQLLREVIISKKLREKRFFRENAVLTFTNDRYYLNLSV